VNQFSQQEMSMNDDKKKKLVLKRSTLRTLSDEETRQVAGGQLPGGGFPTGDCPTDTCHCTESCSCDAGDGGKKLQLP
jgi:hypothetical protein